MTEAKRWKRRPDNSTWGDYGSDDQLGRMNELTAEKVKQGISEVKEGKTFCLSMPLDYPGGNVLNPRRHPPQLRPSVRVDRPNWLYRTEWESPGMTDVINDDVVIMHLQYSTQWDTLAHVGALFDADGDGRRSPCSTMVIAAASTWWARRTPRAPAPFPGPWWRLEAPHRPERLAPRTWR